MKLMEEYLVATCVRRRYTGNWQSTTGGLKCAPMSPPGVVSCVTCASRHVGQAVRPSLTPIPVAGPFDRVGVDILKLPTSYDGHQYAVVFVDYLTKWPEVFATTDQSSITVAQHFVEQIVSRHGVPSELLSDRGMTFLSKLMNEVYRLMGTHKANTTAYHPQTDGLVERLNRTLLDMLAKTVEKNGKNWDRQLPYVLFAYRASLQESTRESPFFLMYGRDPRLPSEETLSGRVRETLDVEDYRSEVASGMAEAWELARANVQKAQKRHKRYHNRSYRLVVPSGRVCFHLHASRETGESIQVCEAIPWPFS